MRASDRDGYREALDQTSVAIERRAKSFRAQALVIVAVLVGAPIIGVATAHVRVLWAWLFLIPICGCLLYADLLILRDWRAIVLALWTDRKLDLEAWRLALLANPRYPRATVEGMLSTLPAFGDLVVEQNVSAATRRAIAGKTVAIHKAQVDNLIFRVVASLVAAAAIVGTAWTGRRVALLALGAIPLLAFGRVLTHRYRRWQCDAELRSQSCRHEYRDAEPFRITGAFK
jgi:hypothetical protein